MTEFYVYDVFSKARFGGNQLAVIPNAITLPEADLQAIAREFNFSETTFVYPPTDAANTARVRIFTPTMEVPFAGHPTLGTAIALADHGAGPDIVLELGVGPIACRAANGAAEFTTTAALEITSSPDCDTVADALGISANQIKTDVHAPTMASLGLAFTITELQTRADLAACVPNVAGFRRGMAAYPSSLDFAQFAYVRQSDDLIHARMFAPLDNIPEDPATGSACATLAALLAQLTGVEVKFEVHQGFDMGRPSIISLSTNGTNVTVAGHAVHVMTGKLL